MMNENVITLRGYNWTIHLNMEAAFPCKQTWLRKFYKLAVLPSDEDPMEIASKITEYLSRSAEDPAALYDAKRKKRLEKNIEWTLKIFK